MQAIIVNTSDGDGRKHRWLVRVTDMAAAARRVASEFPDHDLEKIEQATEGDFVAAVSAWKRMEGIVGGAVRRELLGNRLEELQQIGELMGLEEHLPKVVL